MKELITKKNENFELTNDFTREIDTYLTRKKSRCFSTHFYETPFGDKWLFRYPGATRGNIEVDENMIIKNITLYSDVDDIYNPNAKECFKKYIGMKLVIE